jgi:DNA polymerase III subunit epsilon
MWKSSWVALDTETTGFGKNARILELGLVYFENCVPVQEWSRVLNPPDLDWEDDDVLAALDINGLSKEGCAGQPTFAEVMGDLIEWLKEPVWVGHNIEFDIRMLKQEFDFVHMGWMFRPDLTLCTKNLSYKIDKLGGNKLEDVAERWKVAQPFCHEAIADAKVSGQILAKMIEKGCLPMEVSVMEQFRKEAASEWNRRPKGRK